MRDEEIDRAVEAWKVIVQVQQHFNDIEMKIRNYALTLLLAVSAAVGLALRDDRLGLGIVILFAGLIVWMMFWFMDEAWYHRLLIGAVNHALDLENQLRDYVPGIGLSGSIKDASAIVIMSKGEEEKEKYRISSQLKIRFFYGIIAGLIFVFLLAMLVALIVQD